VDRNDQYGEENVVKKGTFDTRFFEVLIETHSQALYRFARSIVKDDDGAKDVVQETFLYVWKARLGIDMSKNIKSWLFSITYSRAIDYVRKYKKIVMFSGLDTDEGESFGVDIKDDELLADDVFDREVDVAVVQQSLDTLSETDRLLINLHVAEEMTFAEIAHVIEQPLNTVKSRYRRILLKLRKYLAPKYE
jgi:RNA polymerase sigma-70 factor (ECF subfamily)